MQSYRKLEVWRRCHQLVLRSYALTKAFPADERFGLTSQIRRAAASIPANIAEGSVGTPKTYQHYLGNALGSAAELEYHLLLSRDLGYLDQSLQQELEDELQQLKAMLYALRRSLAR